MEHLNPDGIRLLSTILTAVFLPLTAVAIELNRRSKVLDYGRNFAISIAICISSASLFVMLLSWGGLTCDFLPSVCR